MNFKKTMLVSLILLVLLTLSINFALAAEKKPLVAFSQSCMNHPWRTANTNDMLFWAKKLNLDITWANGSNDAANQLADCEDLISKKPDVLILTPIQSKALTSVVDLCNKAGIPLIVIDRNLEVEPGNGMYKCYIGEDQEAEGRACAEFLVQKLHKDFGEYRGNIVELQGTIGSSVTIGRHKGFVDVIDKYPNIKIIASQSADHVREKAIKITEDWLQRFPKGTINAAYAQCDEMAFGFLHAIKVAGRDEIKNVVSLNAQRDQLKAVLDGDLLFVAGNPPYFGEIALKTAIKVINGEKVPAYIDVPFGLFHIQTSEAKKFTEKAYEYLLANDLMYY